MNLTTQPRIFDGDALVQQVLKQIELTGTITAMEHSDCTIMFAYIGGTQVWLLVFRLASASGVSVFCR